MPLRGPARGYSSSLLIARPVGEELRGVIRDEAGPVERRLGVDETSVRLPPGRSVFLLKIGNYRGGWGFYFRITDREARELAGLKWVDVDAP